MADQKITIKTKQVTINSGEPAAKQVAGRWDGETVAGALVKADATQRKTWHVFYPADKADVAQAADGHRDFASKAAVERAAHEFLKNHRQVGAFHKDGTDGAGQIVESGIHHGPDWVGDSFVVKEGDWVGAIEWTLEAWPLVEKGLIRGVSPQGGATRRRPSAQAVAALRSE
jgi:hypothetical protein